MGGATKFLAQFYKFRLLLNIVSKFGANRLSDLTDLVLKKRKKKLEIWGRAQLEAALRRKSDWRDNVVEIPLAATPRGEWNCVSLR